MFVSAEDLPRSGKFEFVVMTDHGDATHAPEPPVYRIRRKEAE